MKTLVSIAIAAALLPCVALAQAKPFAPPSVEIENDGSVDYKTALARYNRAWGICMSDQSATRSADAFVACLNRNLGKGLKAKKQ